MDCIHLLTNARDESHQIVLSTAWMVSTKILGEIDSK
jgi:hypothetical protein